MEKTPRQSFGHVVKNNFWILKFVFKYAPTLILDKIIRIPIGVISSYISVNMTRWILDSVEVSTEFSSIILMIVAIFSFYIGANLIMALFNYCVLPQKQINLNAHMREDVIKKVGRIDQIHFQNPEFFNSYTLALKEIDSRALQVLNSIASAVTAVISFFVVTGVTSSISSDFSKLAIIAVTLEVLMGMLIQKINYRKTVDTTPDGRKRSYINRITYQPEFSPDMKIFPKFVALLLYRYRRATESVKKIIWKYSKKLLLVDQGSQISTVLFRQAIPWIVIAASLFSKEITISEATVLSAAALTIPSTLSSLLTNVGALYPHSMYIDNLKKIYTYPENIETEQADKTELQTVEDIHIEKVSFAYAENSPLVLKEISLEIKKGDKVALVGYNGAGKSTLANLMVRLYDVSSGQIDINEASIKSYNVKSLRSKIAYLSQNFKIYGFSIAENILMRPVEKEEDEILVNSILEKVGLYQKVHAFKNGIRTCVTREFEESGEYFSGGEMQKIALARIYAGNYDCIILDEATSALDPVSEDEIIRIIFDIFKDRTVVMISHRLATIKYVDTVFFMAEGRIAGHGSHHDLMEKNLEYANFYSTQANKYDQQ